MLTRLISLWGLGSSVPKEGLSRDHLVHAVGEGEDRNRRLKVWKGYAMRRRG